MTTIANPVTSYRLITASAITLSLALTTALLRPTVAIANPKSSAIAQATEATTPIEETIQKTKQTYPVDPNNPEQIRTLRLCENAMSTRLGSAGFRANLNTVTESFVSNAQLRYQGIGTTTNRQAGQRRYRFNCLANIRNNRVDDLTYTPLRQMW